MVKLSNEEPPTPGMSGRVDDLVYGNRSTILVSMLLLLLLNVAYWAGSNLAHHLAGGPVAWWVESTPVAAEIGIGLATTALAAAAFVQARAARDLTEVSRTQIEVARKQVEAAEKLADAGRWQTTALRNQNYDRSRPNISIEVRGSSALRDQPREIRSLSPGELLRFGKADGAFYVRNDGPGVAHSIEVRIVGIQPGSPQPGITSREIAKGTRTVSTLGQGQSSQVVFAAPLLEALWPGVGISQDYCILVEATCAAWTKEAEAMELEGFDVDEYSFYAYGGIIAEQVQRSDGIGSDTAWSVLSDSDVSELIRGKVDPSQIPRSVEARTHPKVMYVEASRVTTL